MWVSKAHGGFIPGPTKRTKKEVFEVTLTSKLLSELTTKIEEKLRGGYILLSQGKSRDGGGMTVYYAVVRKP